MKEAFDGPSSREAKADVKTQKFSSYQTAMRQKCRTRSSTAIQVTIIGSDILAKAKRTA